MLLLVVELGELAQDFECRFIFLRKHDLLKN